MKQKMRRKNIKKIHIDAKENVNGSLQGIKNGPRHVHSRITALYRCVHSASGDEQTETGVLLADIQSMGKLTENLRRGVPVLEEVEVSAAGVLHLISDSLASWAREGRDNI